jgi:hypothetical protein
MQIRHRQPQRCRDVLSRTLLRVTAKQHLPAITDCGHYILLCTAVVWAREPQPTGTRGKINPAGFQCRYESVDWVH